MNVLAKWQYVNDSIETFFSTVTMAFNSIKWWHVPSAMCVIWYMFGNCSRYLVAVLTVDGHQ